MTTESVAAAPSDKKFVGSCMIYEAEDLEAVRKLVEDDVYHKTGVVRMAMHLRRLPNGADNALSGTKRSLPFCLSRWRLLCLLYPPYLPVYTLANSRWRIFTLPTCHCSDDQVSNPNMSLTPCVDF